MIILVKLFLASCVVILFFICSVGAIVTFNNSGAMTNEEIVKAKDYCLQNKMNYEIVKSFIGNDVVKVICNKE